MNKNYRGFCPNYWGCGTRNMVVVPSAGSIWDYPCFDQFNIIGSIYEIGPEPKKDFFPPKIPIPSVHVDQPSRFDPEKMEKSSPVEPELSEMKIIIPTVSVATSIPPKPENIPCKSGACKASRIRSDPRSESPWHVLKTIFLIAVVVALIVWVIVYTLLVQYQIL